MLIFTKEDDSIRGDGGVRPSVLWQCDNYQSHLPKWLRTANIDGMHDACLD